MADSIPGGPRLVGKGFAKGDARLKASGAARYAADLPSHKRGVLCGKILRSPHAHAIIESIDTGEAVALEGVYAVVTGQDANAARFGRFLRDRTVLAREKVRFIGDAVAAVAAVDEATANQALALIRVGYRQLPASFSPAESLVPDAPIIHEELASYEDMLPSQRQGNQRNYVSFERGDVEATFAQADIVVEGTFTTQRVHQGFVEPKSCVASLEKDGRVTVWSTTKSPFVNRATISRGLGLPLSKIRVISPTVGADFGGKGAPTIEPICALLAIKSGRTVKIAGSTHDDLTTGFVRHPGAIKLRIAAARDGKLLGLDGAATYDCGAYNDGITGMAHSCTNLPGAYYFPALRLQGRSAFTNSVPTGMVRAPGAPQPFFAIESLMDELARRLGMDPLMIRRINALKVGDPGPDGRGVYGDHGLLETIDQVADYVGARMPERTEGQGLGIACGGWHLTLSGDPGPAKCIVKLNEDGSATLLTGLADNGAGQHVVLSQIVGEVLGLEPEEVAVIAADTDLTPFDVGPGGSRGTTRVGNAAKFAAEDARKQMLALAANKLEANPEDLEIRNRQVNVVGTPARAIPLATLAAISMTSPQGAIVGTGAAEREAWLAEVRAHSSVIDEASFCTHAARVEVDRETGQVTVLDYVAAQDVGFALNRLNTVTQLHGAVMAGLGYALSEEITVHQGRVLNPNYAEYRMPLADTAPTVDTILVERPSPHGPYGARGIGETPVVPVAAVIANAVYDAVGVRIRDLPITPEKVLRALKEKEGTAF